MKVEHFSIFPTSKTKVNGIFHKFGYEQFPHEYQCSFLSDQQSPACAFNPNDECYFVSDVVKNANLSIKFKYHRIKLSHYVIMSFPYECKDHSHPKEWKVEGINQNGEVKLLEHVTDDPICGNNKVSLRNIYTDEFFTTFIFTNLAENHYSEERLVVGKIDFYGIVERSIKASTNSVSFDYCKRIRMSLIFVLLYK